MNYAEIAADRIARERQRQITEEGYTTAHDAAFTTVADLRRAARAYTTNSPIGWPWGLTHFKSHGQVSNLIKAGALVRAATELLDYQGADNPSMRAWLADELAEITSMLAETLSEAAAVLSEEA